MSVVQFLILSESGAFYDERKFGFLKDVIKLKFSEAPIKRILKERCGRNVEGKGRTFFRSKKEQSTCKICFSFLLWNKNLTR